NEWDKHTYTVLSELDAIIESMINMETGQRGYMLTGNEDSLEPYNTGKDNYYEHFKKAKELTSDNPKQQELLGNINKLAEEWISIALEGIDIRKNVATGKTKIEDVVKFEQAAKGKASMDKLRSILSESTEIEETLLESRGMESKKLQDTTKNVLVVGSIIATLLAIIISLLISNIISKPINKLKIIAEKIVVGDTDIKIDIDSNDEIGNLANSFNSVITTLNNLINQMNHMSKQHDLGDIDVNIDEDKFEGAYKNMAIGVNGMVNDHISVNKKAMACIAEFGNGNFEAKIETFPGKKIFINNTIEALRSNLKKVKSEINTLIIASEEGKLNERGDVSKFQGDWAELIKGLNGLLDKVIEPVKEASNVLKEMSKGNLKVMVKGEYKGDHAEIKNSLNFTIQIITNYINEISKILTELSNGNLVVNIDREYLGDFSGIKNSLNMIISSLNEVMGNINKSAEQVATGSIQLSKSSQILSQGSTEQASSIEEITSSMEEMATQTNENNNNASKANEIVLASKDDASSGNKQMQEMLKAMGEINDSSGNIAKIIKVIDEIAFQTNILALNAAVEAARAGQHGKGFAVVAEEVRNLAARSANAAKETTSLIEGSINKVNIGTKIANDTAQALDKIVVGVSKVADIVKGISIASNEQASGIGQANKAIEEVSQVTQTNSATAEESATSSEELSNQAELLKNMILKFKIKNNTSYFKNVNHNINKEIVKTFSGLDDYNMEENKELALNSSSNNIKINLNDDNYGKY
ncbi:MAG: methyl-accepting chemotaxis protein, partial [Clostridiales bacterium]